MTPERWQQIAQAFEAALGLNAEEGSAFLARAGSDDPSLRSEVEALLAADSLQSRTPPSTIITITLVGKRIGAYQIARLIGEGGMGAVYEAEQDHPRRIVALKVIKPGFANPELLRRFERESQVLARLQHSGIAQIYEAGTAETGFGPQPYFAMEYIHGAPLRDYAEAHRLTTRQRLELLARICDAVEHAHQRGIIHRDLKPGNILVDEAGQPKILDFGVARVTDSDAQAATKQTDLGQLIGTLAYMSPEQVLADPLELDTRSDVYSLGVILYELLTGGLPYQLSNKLHEAVRTIREEDPTRLSSIGRAYRGDVETIVAKALEKDKARRYPSAAIMATDIRRYLADEPITARPASASYQLQKFARRHKALVTATGVVFLVLVGGVVVSTREAVLARQAEQTAKAVNDFLQNDLLAQAGAIKQLVAGAKPDPDLKVRTALDRAAERIAGKFDRQPQVEAAIRQTIGQAYLDLGLYPKAQEQFERVLRSYRATRGANDPKTLEALSSVGVALYFQGKNAEAEKDLNQALENQRRVLGPENGDTLDTQARLGNVYYSQGKFGRAEEIHNQILQIRRRLLGAEHPSTLESMQNLASALSDDGKFAQAEALDNEALQTRRRVLGPEHPATLMTMNNLAANYYREGNYAKAAEVWSEARDIQRRVLGPDHPDTLLSMSNLAAALGSENKFAEAEALDKEILEARRRVLGAAHPDTLRSLNNLAFINYVQGKYALAEATFSEAVEIRRRVSGTEHPDTLLAMNNLANVYYLQGKYGPAEELFTRTLEIRSRALGAEHPSTLDTISDFSSMYQMEGKYGLAESYASRALAGRRRALGPQHPDTAGSVANLALVYLLEGKFAEGEPLAREAADFYRKQQMEDWPRFFSDSLLGESLAGEKKYAEAEPLLLGGYQGMVARKDSMSAPDRYCLGVVHTWLVQLFQAMGQPEKAAEWRKK